MFFFKCILLSLDCKLQGATITIMTSLLHCLPLLLLFFLRLVHCDRPRGYCLSITCIFLCRFLSVTSQFTWISFSLASVFYSVCNWRTNLSSYRGSLNCFFFFVSFLPINQFSIQTQIWLLIYYHWLYLSPKFWLK